MVFIVRYDGSLWYLFRRTKASHARQRASMKAYLNVFLDLHFEVLNDIYQILSRHFGDATFSMQVTSQSELLQCKTDTEVELLYELGRRYSSCHYLLR